MNKTQTENSISPLELQRRLAAGQPAQLLDVRTPGEYANAHVPGARLIPLDELNAAAFCRERKGAGTPLYVLCQSGNRAKRAVNRDESRVLPLMRQVQIVVGFVSAVGAALALAVHPWFALISLLTGGGLLFAGLTGFCGLALVLAKMPWNKTSICHSTACCTPDSK